MSQRTKKVDAQLFLERMTIHDKVRRITMPQPTEYHLRICAHIGDRSLIIREFVFGSKAEQTEHYQRLRHMMRIDPK